MARHDVDRWRVQRQNAVANHSKQYLNHILEYSGSSATDLDAVEKELANLLTGMKQAYKTELLDAVIDYAGVLCRPGSGCLGIRGYRAELNQLLQIALDAARRRNRLEDEASLHHNLALLAMSQGKMATAKTASQTAFAQFAELQDARGMARSKGLQATLFRLQGKYAQARQALESLLERFKELNDTASLGVTYSQLGRLAEVEKDGPAAEAYYQADLALEEADGDERGIALARWGLGNAAYLQNDLEKAQQHYQAALQMLEVIGDKQNLAGLLGQLANLERNLGNTPQAEKLFWQVVELSHSLGDPVVESMALFNLAALYRQLDNLPQAIELMKAVVAIEEEAGLADLEQDRRALAQLEKELILQQEVPSSTSGKAHEK